MKPQSETPKTQVAEKFAKALIERMEQLKGENWEKGWIGGGMAGFPQNISGRAYSGGNAFFLQMFAGAAGYTMAAFMTFQQARNLGASVLKGEKSWPVAYTGVLIKDKDNNAITDEQYKQMTEAQKAECEKFVFNRSFNVFNIDQTNLHEVNPELYKQFQARFQVPEIKDAQGMYVSPSLDKLVADQAWVCPIKTEAISSKAYYSLSKDEIVVPNKAQFNLGGEAQDVYRGGMHYYATMLHEMTHSTLTAERLNRDTGKRFADPKYAREELVAEMTSALVSSAMGFDAKITDNSAKYLDAWIGKLKESPQFIMSILSDVNKASEMVIEAIDKQKIALGEKPIKAEHDPKTKDLDLEAPYKESRIIKNKDGDYMLRGVADGKDLGIKPLTDSTAKAVFKITDQREKDIMVSSLAGRLFKEEINTRYDHSQTLKL